MTLIFWYGWRRSTMWVMHWVNQTIVMPLIPRRLFISKKKKKVFYLPAPGCLILPLPNNAS